ncbi:MAG: aldo/keto reductase [Armatimonadetes bacterium]|nr:aldo/keto reductase [Armatimonadota bacterium]
MQYRRFGKTGWQVSEIGLGGSWFYGRPEEGELPPEHGIGVVHRALELGINYFDTAPLYGRGRSEEIMGMALEGVTQPYYLATKVGYYPEPFDYTRDTVWRGFEASLKRLRRDRVDLIQIHESEQAGWEGMFGPGRTLEALREIRDQGLAQHIGITGADLDLMSEAIATGEFASVITYLRYDLLVQDACTRLIPTAVAHDTAVILASPLHAGLLGSKRDDWIRVGRFPHLHDKLERLEALLANEAEEMPHLGLRYLLSDPRTTVVLSGVRNIPELEASVAVSDGVFLSPEYRARLEAV